MWQDGKSICCFFSETYEPIDTASLKLKTSKSGDTKRVSFEDGKHRYNYNPSKSTLFKTFHIPADAVKIDIQILEDPYEMLLRFAQLQPQKTYRQEPFVILPLYSTRSVIKGGEKYVPQHSGLNQWNAGGRERKSGEVYIPVPWDIHKRYGDFFPPPRHDLPLEGADRGDLRRQDVPRKQQGPDDQPQRCTRQVAIARHL